VGDRVLEIFSLSFGEGFEELGVFKGFQIQGFGLGSIGFFTLRLF